MNDPHVVALVYGIKNRRTIDYREAEPLDADEKDFSIHVEDEQVHFTMKAHYETIEEAKKAVRESIEHWEFTAGLKRGPGAFKLVYQHAQIVDRRPPPKRDGSVRLFTTFQLGAGTGSATLHTSLGQYPKPPSTGLTITPDVQSMYDRLMGYRSNREPLPSMAYFCLTVLRLAAGLSESDNEVVEKYAVEKKVLSKIVKLSTNKGGAYARKASGTRVDLTPSETRFLEKAIVALIRRAAEVAHDPDKSRDEIKLSDFCP